MSYLVLDYSMNRNSIYYDDIVDEYATILEQWNVEVCMSGTLIMLDFSECDIIHTHQDESTSLWHIEDYTDDADLVKAVLNFGDELEAIDNEGEEYIDW